MNCKTVAQELSLGLAMKFGLGYLPMLSHNEGYNETGLTMQSAGPIRQPWQPIAFEFLFKGSEFGH